MTLTQIKELVRDARRSYPTRSLQRQLVRKTVYLIERNIHALYLPKGTKYPTHRES